jgi:hypothetical protein
VVKGLGEKIHFRAEVQLMMKSLFRKYWYLTVVALLCCVPMAFGQTDTMTLEPMPGGQPSLGGVYTGAYPFSINGSSTITTAVCDDFADQIYVGESWTANVTQLSSLVGTGTANQTVYFGRTGSALSQATLYDQVAYLVQQMYNPANSALTSDISYAIWNIFDPGAASGLSSGDQSEVASLIASAGANYTGINTSSFQILSALPNSQNPSTDGRPQEFIVYTPESSAVILFGADMLGLLGLAILFRRRLLRSTL